jgi:hypothetical protein
VFKLLTIADGFGDNNAYPEWYPDYYKWTQIIKLMTKNVDLINYSKYGAGNEYIIYCLKEHINLADFTLVQWAQPNRVDLLVNTPEHFKLIAQDPVYHNNIVDINGTSYWLSSGSKLPEVRAIKDGITMQQHQNRSQLFIDYATMFLEHNKYKFLLTADSDYLKINNNENWVWHSPKKGMDSFRFQSNFASLDFGYTQPIPLIAFDFIKKFIMPTSELPWRSLREIDAVENMLLRKYNQYIVNKPND